MLIAGWKSVSTVDVRGKPSFVVWLCGCNLQCPFCHNWKIADATVCRDVRVSDLIDRILKSAFLVDYVHVSGGEPLVQVPELVTLFREVRSTGMKTSLNSNLTIYESLVKVLEHLDHVATDVKIPHLMYGVGNWETLYMNFLKSVKELAEAGISLEFRVPIVRFPVSEYVKVLEDVLSVLGESRNYQVVFVRVVGEPLVTPRRSDWCKKFCVGEEEFMEYVELIKKRLSHIIHH